MKCALFVALFGIQIALPQIRSGTVVYYDFAKDEITFSADSRSANVTNGEQVDTHCKISAFGDKFVFVATGFTIREHIGHDAHAVNWSAHKEARAAWETAVNAKINDASTLVSMVSQEWTAAVEAFFSNPDLIRIIGTRLVKAEDPIIIGGLFAATDTEGNLVLTSSQVLLDLNVFVSTGKIRLWHEFQNGRPDSWGTGGHDEIVNEFKRQSSTRAREHMQRFLTSIASLTPAEQRAVLATELVRLSISLYPQTGLLGGPIDVVQLHRRTGVKWIHRKGNCPQN
jgi:hypothetical protein